MQINNQATETKVPFPWAVAVFAAREGARELLLTINAIRVAAVELTVIDVMVNGNPELAAEVSSLLKAERSTVSSAVVRVWATTVGDKANAWNQYVHVAWPGARLSFFVDGYVRVKPDAFSLLRDGLTSSPSSLGGTGVPTVGRTAAKSRLDMLATGGLQGNLFALTEATMGQIRHSQFKLPLGLYRTDSTLGAALAYGLDPSRNSWDLKNRILVHPGVTWTTEKKKWWRFGDIKTQFKRAIRQAQGVLENRAVANFLTQQKRAPENLPHTASEMVEDWIRECPNEATTILRNNPIIRMALKRLRDPRDWSEAAQMAHLADVIE